MTRKWVQVSPVQAKATLEQPSAIKSVIGPSITALLGIYSLFIN
jgi:hypothetical protein